jgi:HKD family nuclease
MNIQFVSSDPHAKARPHLTRVLSHGTDQLAIACAYCTPAGVELLKPYSVQLNQAASFLVVSGEKPTSFTALAELHALAPNRIFVHFGGVTPYETNVGASRMHTKLFYARSNERCMLWVGSNNLTASATQGVNCEAAILAEGDANEQIFQEALAHAQACKNEAVPFDPAMVHLDEIEFPQSDTLIIHSEGFVSEPQWSALMRVAGNFHDKLFAVQIAVRLYLYGHGDLVHGWQQAIPHSAYEGTMTGVNLTERHPEAAGLAGEWVAPEYLIHVDYSSRIPKLRENDHSHPTEVTTQAIINLTGRCSTDDIWLTRQPKMVSEPKVIDQKQIQSDSDMHRFFARRSFVYGNLVYKRIGGFERTLKVNEQDVREREVSMIEQRLQMRIDRTSRTERNSGLGKMFDSQAPCIYRAKFRLDDHRAKQ